MDTTPVLDESKGSAFRSLVGALLYVSHDRADIQFAAKTLAASLKNPTLDSWLKLRRVIGYLKKTEGMVTALRRTSTSSSLFSKLNDDEEVGADYLLLESFSDSDWGGSTGCKSTSSAAHFLAGNCIHTSSRSQKAISLSSTESEWYAALSASIDALYLRHILEHLHFKVMNFLRIDNSAVISISQKMGVSRLRHIEGKLLWLQSKVSSGELSPKAVGTAWNVSDIGTKPLGKEKFLVFKFLLGFEENGKPVGEECYWRLLREDQFKVKIKHVKRILRELQQESSEEDHRTQISSFANLFCDPGSSAVRRLIFMAFLQGAAAVNPSVESVLSHHNLALSFVAMVVILLVCCYVVFMHAMPSSFTQRSEPLDLVIYVRVEDGCYVYVESADVSFTDTEPHYVGMS